MAMPPPPRCAPSIRLWRKRCDFLCKTVTRHSGALHTMSFIKKAIKLIPYSTSLYARIKSSYISYIYSSKGEEKIFTEIYKKNIWSGNDSISGKGSDSDQTRTIIKELSCLLHELEISSMLDIPCGDFNWMRKVDLGNVNYIGADIVEDIIKNNSCLYTTKTIRFSKINLIKDSLPMVDLILCRDCLVHFSFENIFNSLYNICASRSRYLLTTTFPDRHKNHDILTGQWRPLNLEIEPFSLGPPLKLIKEHCTENSGAYSDKSLALWRISDIKTRL